MISNPGTVLSRVLETVTEPGPRIEKLRKVAAVLRETAGFRWVGLYDVDHAKGEVINLVWAGPSTRAILIYFPFAAPLLPAKARPASQHQVESPLAQFDEPGQLSPRSSAPGFRSVFPPVRHTR
jgi:hypothetical protein